MYADGAEGENQEKRGRKSGPTVSILGNRRRLVLRSEWRRCVEHPRKQRAGKSVLDGGWKERREGKSKGDGENRVVRERLQYSNIMLTTNPYVAPSAIPPPLYAFEKSNEKQIEKERPGKGKSRSLSLDSGHQTPTRAL